MTTHIDVRTLIPEDQEQLFFFLSQHEPTSLALLSNIEKFGIQSEQAEISQAHYIGVFDDGHLQGVLSLGIDDLVMVQCPQSHYLDYLIEAWRDWFDGGARGCIGPKLQIDDLCRLINLNAEHVGINNTETVYGIEAASLVFTHDVDEYSCRLAQAEDMPLLCAWYHSFLLELLPLKDNESLRQKIYNDRWMRLKNQQLFLFTDTAGVSIGMIEVVVLAREIVQVGTLFLPPDLRGKNLGIKLLHCLGLWLRDHDVTRIYFLAAPPLEKLTQQACALGFEEMGHISVVLFREAISPPKEQIS